MEDKYGFIEVGTKLANSINVGQDHRKEYVNAKKEYFRAIITLSDAIDELQELDYSLVSKYVANVGYNMQKLITVLASQAPTDGETFDPFTNTGEQLTTGMDSWQKDINVNTEGYITSLNIDTEQFTMYGLDCFANSLLNTDTTDVVLAMYLSLVNYLTKHEVTTIEQINKQIIEL